MSAMFCERGLWCETISRREHDAHTRPLLLKKKGIASWEVFRVSFGALLVGSVLDFCGREPRYFVRTANVVRTVDTKAIDVIPAKLRTDREYTVGLVLTRYLLLKKRVCADLQMS